MVLKRIVSLIIGGILLIIATNASGIVNDWLEARVTSSPQAHGPDKTGGVKPVELSTDIAP